MDARTAVDRTLVGLVSAYADRAPTGVDPVAMTRLARADARSRRSWWDPARPADPVPAFGFLLVALLTAILVGTLVAGGLPARRHPADPLIRQTLVQPFVGLPPVGATPSAPETGTLVLDFGGRVRAHELSYDRTSLYEDGRLIRVRERGPQQGLVEQLLTPDGVQLVLARAHAAGLSADEPVGGSVSGTWRTPGVLWGSLSLRQNGQMVSSGWSDSLLPELLASPESWLPPTAWLDARPGGYVAAHYGFCIYDDQVEPSRVLAAVPADARDVLAAGSRGPDAGNPDRPTGCRIQLTPDAARAVATAFDRAGYAHEPGWHSLGFRVALPSPNGTRDVPVYFLPILPDGQVVCECG